MSKYQREHDKIIPTVESESRPSQTSEPMFNNDGSESALRGEKRNRDANAAARGFDTRTELYDARSKGLPSARDTKRLGIPTHLLKDSRRILEWLHERGHDPLVEMASLLDDDSISMSSRIDILKHLSNKTRPDLKAVEVKGEIDHNTNIVVLNVPDQEATKALMEKHGTWNEEANNATDVRDENEQSG